MNRIAFYGGLILIIFGILMWAFRPNKNANNNTIKAFGMEFSVTTQEFFIMIFGLIMMIISVKFPEVLGPPPPAKNHIQVQSTLYQSKYTASKSCGFSYAATICNNLSSCKFGCKNDNSDCKDPDRGVEKRCIIRYICSDDPNNVKIINVPDSDIGLTPMSCP